MRCPGKKRIACLILMLVFLPALPSHLFADAEIPSAVHNTPAFPDDFFIDLVVPSHRLYLGEIMRIEYDVYVAKSRGILHYDNREPEFDAWFTFEDKVAEPSFVVIENKTYAKEPYAAFYVAPLKPGKVPLPTLSVTVPYKHPTPWITHVPHTVEVLLPPEPYPDNFDLHHVGKIHLEAVFPENRVIEAGKPFSYTLSITSNTPTDGMTITTPPIDAPNARWKHYPLKKINQASTTAHGQFQSTTEYRATVVAYTPGTYTLPASYIVFFNPESQKYETTSVPEFEFTVLPSTMQPEQPPIVSALELDTASPHPLTLYAPSPLLHHPVATSPEAFSKEIADLCQQAYALFLQKAWHQALLTLTRLEDLLKASGHATLQPDILYHQALAYYHLQQYPEAFATLRQLSIAQNTEQTRKMLDQLQAQIELRAYKKHPDATFIQGDSDNYRLWEWSHAFSSKTIHLALFLTTLLGAVAVLGLFFVRKHKRSRRLLQILMIYLGIFYIFVSVLLFLRMKTSDDTFAILLRAADMHTQPDANAPSAFKDEMLEGATLQIRSRHDTWVLVERSDGKMFWIPQDHLYLLRSP